MRGGARTLSKRFLIWTVINAFVLSAVLDILQTINFPIMDDIFLVAVAGGVIKGLGIGLLYREGIRAGGLDIAISVPKKRYGMEVGRLSFYFNMVILAVSFSIIGPEKVMYGFISCYICGMTMDSVLASFDKRRLVFIVASNTDAVVEFINKRLGRGCTLLSSEGGYKRRDGFTIMCLLMPRQVVELKRFLAEHFPSSPARSWWSPKPTRWWAKALSAGATSDKSAFIRTADLAFNKAGKSSTHQMRLRFPAPRASSSASKRRFRWVEKEGK